MKSIALKTTMIAAIATLGLNGTAWAHHPSEDTNPNFDFVDEQVSDMHNEVIDAMLEDDDLMSSTARGMDATTMSQGMAADDSTESQAVTQVGAASDSGSGNATRSGSRR